MIIICSGPDTYRAREKARELTAAFQAKHDPEGYATETIDGSDGLAAILPRLGSLSLFAKKRFVRADGCLKKMKIADVRTLAAKLEMDKDQTIIVTVEEEPPASKILETLKNAPLHHYPFEPQRGASFRTWVRDLAKKEGVPQTTADAVAEYADGDSWLAMQEISKAAANPGAFHSERENVAGSVFDVADAALVKRPGWRIFLQSHMDDNPFYAMFSQARSYLSVRDGMTDGVHPYVVKKIGSLRVDQPEKRFREYLRAQLASRNGMATESELDSLL